MQRNAILAMAVPAALLMLGGMAKTYGDDHDKKTVVQFSEPVQIPGGMILQPGKYVLILLNSASNRNIVEIRNEDSTHLYAMTFTTRAARVTRTSDAVLTYYEMPAGTPPALRQWFWPGDYDGQEFLYPHKQALEITQASHQIVPELPADQATNQPADVSAAPAAASVSDAAAVSAENAPAPAQSSQSDVSASAQQSTVPVQTSAQASAQTDTSVSNQQAVQPNQQLAQVTPPPDNSQRYSPAPDTSAATSPQSSNADPALPQTASDLPLIALLGLASMAMAAGVRFAARGRV